MATDCLQYNFIPSVVINLSAALASGNGQIIKKVKSSRINVAFQGQSEPKFHIFNSHNAMWDGFCYEQTITCYCQLTLSAVSKNEWVTKEDTGKSIKNALYIL